jgi:glutathione S-transferase
MTRLMKTGDGGVRPLGPPFLRVRRRLIAQTANILAFVAPELGLISGDRFRHAEALQHQLTVADLVTEVHDTHHPIATGLYHEEQKREAAQRARHFRDDRMPLFLGYFEDLLRRGSRRYLVGARHSYADLSLFQVLTGLEYAFPNAFAQRARRLPLLVGLRERIRERPNIARYLASERRIPFNEMGIFRRYPELDAKRASKARPARPD